MARVVFLGGFRKRKQFVLLLCWFLQAVFVPGVVVWFVRVWVFASGAGAWLGGLFCSRVGFPQWQLYAAVFVVRGVLRPCKPFVLSRCFFLHAVLGSCGAACFVMGRVVWGFSGRFVLSRCFFLHAVLVPGGAICFVLGRVVWVFFKKIGRFGFLFIVNFCLQNTISGQ